MRFFIVLSAVFLLVSNSYAQETFKVIGWEFNLKKKGNAYELECAAQLEEPWAVYSHYLPQEADPIPFSITILTDEAKAVSEIKEKGKEITYDEIYGKGIGKYKNKVSFIRKYSVPEGTTKLKGFITYMVCNGSQCLPPAAISFDLPLDAKALKEEEKVEKNN